MSKLNSFDLQATVYYQNGVGYVLYIFEYKNSKSECIGALEYDNVADLLADLKILVQRDSWGALHGLDKTSYERRQILKDVYNNAHESIEIPGVEVIIITTRVIIYQHNFPAKDYAVLLDCITYNERIEIPRIGFKC